MKQEHTKIRANSHAFQIKEGAEKLREVTTDRRSLSDVASIVKKSNSKLAELKSELHELESQILLTKGNTVSNGQGESHVFFHSTNVFSVIFNKFYSLIISDLLLLSSQFHIVVSQHFKISL